MKRILTVSALLLMAITCRSQTPVIDSLLKVVAQHRRDTNEIRALDYLSTEFMRRDMTTARNYAYQQIALSNALRTHFGLSAGYAGLVTMHQDEGRLDSAQYYLDKLAALAKEIPADKKTSANYYTTAGLFYKNQGKYKEALPYLKGALRFIDPSRAKTNYAGQLLNIGNAYYAMGDFTTAADYYLRSLSYFEDAKSKRGQSFCLQNLGHVFFELGQYAVAEKYLFQSEKLKEELSDKRGILTCWMALGSLYEQTNKTGRAMDYFNKALARATELNLTIEQSRVLFNLGSLLKTMKKPDESRKRFNASLMLARQTGDSALASRIRSYLVALQDDVQKEKSEEQTLLQNINVSLEKGTLATTAEGHLQLADWYASHKQFEKAFANLKKGQQLNDSLKGDAVIMQLKKLEQDYKNEKQEKEISLLKKDQELRTLQLSRQRIVITAIALALLSVVAVGFLLVNRYRVMNKAKRLIEVERVRNSIARDLHDDIGSTLSSINIMSQVALVEKNSPDTYLQRIGDQSARMMEDLSDMVWSINPRNDSMDQVINRMREFATEIFELKGIEYGFHADAKAGLVLTAEQRKNLFLIFKESVNNAAKYSMASRVEITLEQQDNFLVMRVEDNGHGFDAQAPHQGNGLRNLRERTKEIGGTLKLESILKEGTMVEARIPIA